MSKEPSMRTYVIINVLLLSVAIVLNFSCYKTRLSVINGYRDELRAYRDYYLKAECVLFYSASDSVPGKVYDQYLDAVADVQKYMENE